MNDIDGVKIYTREELLELFEKVIALGLEGELNNSMTIGQIDALVNGKLN